MKKFKEKIEEYLEVNYSDDFYKESHSFESIFTLGALFGQKYELNNWHCPGENPEDVPDYYGEVLIATDRFEYVIGYYRADLKCFVEKDTGKKLSIREWKHISPPGVK